MQGIKCKCGMEIPFWAKEWIELNPEIHIVPAQLKSGSFIHKYINGVAHESEYVNISPLEVTIDKLKELKILDAGY